MKTAFAVLLVRKFLKLTMNGIKAIGAGTSKDAAMPVSGDLMEWADIVFVADSLGSVISRIK